MPVTFFVSYGQQQQPKTSANWEVSFFLCGSLNRSSSLLVTPQAVGASGREEPLPAVLAAAVAPAPVLAARRAAHAVGQAGEEETGDRGPHEGEGLDSQPGGLVVGVELVPALDVDGTAGLIVNFR